MKKNLFVFWLLLGFIPAATAQKSAQKPASKAAPKTASKPAAAKKETVQPLNTFSFDLYKTLAAKNQTGNMFLSPYSVYGALLLAAEGANSTTKEEFRKLLYLEKDSLKAAEANRKFKAAKGSNPIQPALQVANSIWVNKRFSLKDTYKKALVQQYGATVQAADFANSNTAATQINQWASQQTKGLIKDIIPPDRLNSNTAAVLVNAVYFMGKWTTPFDPENTREAPFYNLNRSSSQTPFMELTHDFRYHEQKEFKAVGLPYTGETAMILVLPTDRYGLPAVEKMLSPVFYSNLLGKMSKRSVWLKMPKFKLEDSYSLPQDLKQIGLQAAFTSNADFSRMLKEPQPLKINDVLHKTFISVDEKQTKAAAVTVIEELTFGSSEDEPLSKIFHADHAFLFLIINRNTQDILFVGRFAEVGK